MSLSGLMPAHTAGRNQDTLALAQEALGGPARLSMISGGRLAGVEDGPNRAARPGYPPQFHVGAEPDGTEVRVLLDPDTHRPREIRYAKRLQTLAPDLAGRRVQAVVTLSDSAPVDEGLTLAHTIREVADSRWVRTITWRSITVHRQ